MTAESPAANKVPKAVFRLISSAIGTAICITYRYALKKCQVKCQGVIGLPKYGFLLMFNSNIGPRLLYEI